MVLGGIAIQRISVNNKSIYIDDLFFFFFNKLIDSQDTAIKSD